MRIGACVIRYDLPFTVLCEKTAVKQLRNIPGRKGTRDVRVKISWVGIGGYGEDATPHWLVARKVA